MSTSALPMGGEGGLPLAEADLDLRYYAGVLWRGRWLVVVAAKDGRPEETGRLLQKIVAEEVEPVIKELSAVLLHSSGSRSELDNTLTKFETAMNRMKSAHTALKTAVGKVEEVGENFPTK